MAPKRQNASGGASTSSITPAANTAITSSTLTSSSATTSAGTTYLSSKSSAKDIAYHLWQRYLSETPQRIYLLDSFMVFLVAVGAAQFVYCVIGGNYPFNAFLSGFCAAVGQFVLTASLRMQTLNSPSLTESSTNKGNEAKQQELKQEENTISSERAFADYIFGSLILHFFCINFIN